MAIDLYSKATTDTLLSAKLSISSLSNAATSTLNATAPTTGQALTFDGTDLVWATVGGGGGSYLPLAGGAMNSTALVTYSNATYNSEIGGWGFGVELTSDTTQNASIQYNAVSVQNGSGTMTMGPTGLTFPDATTQTTAAWTSGSGDLSLGGYSITNGNVDCGAGFVTAQNVTLTSGGVLTFPDSTTQTTAASPFNGGTITNPILIDQSATSGFSTTFNGNGLQMGGGQYISQEESMVNGFNVQLPVGGSITFGDSTTQTTAAVAPPSADTLKANAIISNMNYFYGSSGTWVGGNNPVPIVAASYNWGIYNPTDGYIAYSYTMGNTFYMAGTTTTNANLSVQVNGSNSSFYIN